MIDKPERGALGTEGLVPIYQVTSKGEQARGEYGLSGPFSSCGRKAFPTNPWQVRGGPSLTPAFSSRFSGDPEFVGEERGLHGKKGGGP